MARFRRKRSKKPRIFKPSFASKRKNVAEGLKQAVGFYLLHKGYSCTYELGISAWGKHRADVIGCRLKGQLVMVEVKSSVADFRADHKWPEYVRSKVVDQFYFAFTEDTWNKIQAREDLRTRIRRVPGVLLLSETTGYVYVKKRAALIEIPESNRVAMLARLAWRQGELSKRTTARRQRVYVSNDPSVNDSVEI
jgi:hypothetical protein